MTPSPRFELSASAPALALSPVLCLALSLPLWLALTWPAAALASDHGEPAKAAKPAAAEAHGTKVATAPDTLPAGDAMDTLRQRLSEKLANTKPEAGGLPGELRVTIKSAAPKPAAGGHGAPAKKSGAKAEDGHGAGEAAHWSYNGPGGPQAWASLKPEFSLCASGQRQSPIDIRGGLAVDLEPVRFDYQASRFAVVDNGHTVQVNLAQGNAIEVGGKRYELLQFHFHRPSEERIDGRQFEMSLHLVHKNDQGQLAVVGLLFDKGPAQAVLQQVWNNLPLERNEENPASTPIELNELLPNDRRYYTYMGSLTTPPCSEGVKWIVMRQPVTLTKDQIDIFARMYPMNARPIQAVAGRRIIQSN
jgi:carbonic anhydrase